MLRKHTKIHVVLVTVAVAASFVACGAKKDKDAEKTVSTDVPVKVEKAGTAEVATVLSYGADLRPSSKIRLLSLMTDTILSLPWQDGDELKKGEVVAVVKKDGLTQGLAQIDAQATALDVQIAQLKVELDRVNELFRKGVATQQAVDQLTAQHAAAVAQKDAIVAGRRQLAVTVGNTVIKAPVDGVFSSKAYEVGDIATPQLPLGILLVTDPMKVELKLIEKDIALVKVGQLVDLRLDAFPGRVFQGTVTRVFPYVDSSTRTNTVEVTVPNPRLEDGTRELKPGMFGTASLVVERRKDVVMAPESALLLDNKLLASQKEGEELRRLFVVDSDNVAHERIARLGSRDGNRWEIADGLKAGETIVVRGQHGLSEGKKVRIVEDEAKPAAEGSKAPAQKAAEPAPAAEKAASN